MSKRVLCIPEIFVYFARLPHMEKSFRVDTIYAPGPTCPDDANNSMKLYTKYRDTEEGSDALHQVAWQVPNHVASASNTEEGLAALYRVAIKNRKRVFTPVASASSTDSDSSSTTVQVEPI